MGSASLGDANDGPEVFGFTIAVSGRAAPQGWQSWCAGQDTSHRTVGGSPGDQDSESATMRREYFKLIAFGRDSYFTF